MKTQTEALKRYLDDCDKHAIVPDIAGAFHFAWQEALAQPEQEPVEWGVDWGKDGNSVSIIKRLADGSIEVLGWEYAPHPPQRTEQEQQIETLKRCLFQMQEAAKNLVEQAKSLPPPQRKPLTDEEIGAILEGVNAYGTRLYTFARAIEVAHNIKE